MKVPKNPINKGIEAKDLSNKLRNKLENSYLSPFSKNTSSNFYKNNDINKTELEKKEVNKINSIRSPVLPSTQTNLQKYNKSSLINQEKKINQSSFNVTTTSFISKNVKLESIRNKIHKSENINDNQSSSLSKVNISQSIKPNNLSNKIQVISIPRIKSEVSISPLNQNQSHTNIFSKNANEISILDNFTFKLEKPSHLLEELNEKKDLLQITKHNTNTETKDNSNNSTIKNLKESTDFTQSKKNIENPEDLHYFYVRMIQSNKDLIYKFEKDD